MAQLSPGDLASAHESLDGISNCTQCHELGEGPSQEKCLACHTLIQDRLNEQRGYHHQVVTVDGSPCFDCHSDHAGRTFDLVHWPEGRDAFDHLQTGFALVGRHAQLQCRDCHHPGLVTEDLRSRKPDKDLVNTFLGLGTACLDCHQDQHQGQLGSDCLQCHTDNSFRPVATFDHDKAAFVLTGKHLTVECAKCHPVVSDINSAGLDVSYRKYVNIQHDNCTACHQDKHQSRFGLDCTRCHQTTGWNSVQMAGFDHRRTAFPLVGLHASVKCDKCHRGESMTASIPHTKCTDCHDDTHQGQFAQRSDGGLCTACHSEHGFQPALYTVSDHAMSTFPLLGAHLAQPCGACHRDTTSENGTAYRVFKLPHDKCSNCHSDIHAGQFSDTSPVKNCTACHDNQSWQRIGFEHNRDSQYRLEGAHENVACSGCHFSEKVGGDEFVRYRPIAHRCEDCHLVGSPPREL